MRRTLFFEAVSWRSWVQIPPGPLQFLNYLVLFALAFNNAKYLFTLNLRINLDHFKIISTTGSRDSLESEKRYNQGSHRHWKDNHSNCVVKVNQCEISDNRSNAGTNLPILGAQASGRRALGCRTVLRIFKARRVADDHNVLECGFAPRATREG